MNYPPENSSISNYTAIPGLPENIVIDKGGCLATLCGVCIKVKVPDELLGTCQSCRDKIANVGELIKAVKDVLDSHPHNCMTALDNLRTCYGKL